jgi:hypothetical protein
MAKIFSTYLIMLSVVCLSAKTIVMGGTSTRSIVATRCTSSPRIDGSLSDDVWRSAVPVTGFQQFDPNEGEPATEQTTVRILYDDNALYVGVMCYDSDPSGIVKQLTRRDRSGQSDRFTMTIDSYHDHNTAFLFSGTASGIQIDGTLAQDGRAYDVQWDAVWEFDAQEQPDGWSAEFKIPYSALRFAEQDSEYIWGINFRRYIARKKETDEWVMVARKDAPPGTISSISKMGHLSGITNIHPPLRIELLPYGVVKRNYFAQPNPFPTRSEWDGTFGLDAKYGLTNNFTLDMAINPDFGQVEVDQAVLNLTVFETQYPEKRPFFLEGAPLFAFGNTFDNQQLRLFYSRRIGRTPSLSQSSQPGYAFAENPQVTTILGAAKLTGRTDDGLSVGVISATTKREEAIEEDINGNRSAPYMIEPRGSYNVVRIKKDVLDQSSIGLMATGTFKERQSPAVSGGVDWNLAFENSTYLLDGYLAGSQLNLAAGMPQSGSAGKIAFGKSQDEHWLAFTSYDFATRNFSINDIGFFSQPHEHGGYLSFTYKEDHALEPFLRYSVATEVHSRWNWDAINTTKFLEIEPVLEFRNFWTLTLDYIHEFPAFDDEQRGIIGLYRRPSNNQFTATVESDARQPIVAALHGGYSITDKHASTLYSVVQLTLRPNPWIELAPAFTFVHTRNEEAWVTSSNSPYYFYTDDGYNLFGDRDIDQQDFSLRGMFTFTRRVSLQFFTQVFLAKGHYTNFRKLQGQEDLPAYAYLASRLYVNPDFNEKVLNANVVFRWEYLPGSTFYLVWTQARYGIDNATNKKVFDNFFDTFKLPMDNVILAKISYFWSL